MVIQNMRDNKGRFLKGISPWNKGMKKPCGGGKGVCNRCKNNFITNVHNQIFCSLDCRNISYKNNPRMKKENLEKTLKYQNSIKGKQTTKKYKNSAKCKEDANTRLKKYQKSGKRQETLIKYAQSERGKLTAKVNCRKRRAMKNNIIELFTNIEWVKKLKDVNNICLMCDKKRKLTLDHIYPVNIANNDFEKTGVKRTYTINDIQPLCRPCNSAKNNHLNYQKT